ncbi:rRNA large subunit methyltransferase [Oceanococcus atlanticus]|uniref:Ribosomal RNA large subunit methyltransferase H n=1 Tax=Oceanococcus atlanticus TaxID=1317117 RepID=A0A1Y1SA57_9GAMM|nr:23S rRNA (pseudouridine(1915)-N(3))-methyltransferase RlmH [Oceanococcus atlanticus]ORE85216.1 rRNA large subunit methyltransferase [Oceanococcus atlanticus]
MKLRVLCIGKRMPAWVDAGVEDFLKRFTRQFPLSLDVVDAAPRKAGMSSEQLQEADTQRLIQRLKPNERVVLLDERGVRHDTRGFAARIEQWQLDGPDVALVIGGADGHSKAFRKHASELISLSPMTMPHGLARLMLVEQVYRAWTVISGHPYHRD